MKGLREAHPYLPRLTEAANGCSVQTHYDGKETVEIPLCFAAVKDQGAHESVACKGKLPSTRADAVY